MTGRLALVALALLASACGRPAPAIVPTTACLLYSVDPSFGPEERAELGKGAAVWRDSGICVAEARTDVRVIRVAKLEDVPLKHKKIASAYVAFFAHDERAIYMLMTEMRIDQIRNVFIHEIGHAMGAQHIPQLGSCLFPGVTDLCAIGGHVLNVDARAVQPSYQDH